MQVRGYAIASRYRDSILNDRILGRGTRRVAREGDGGTDPYQVAHSDRERRPDIGQVSIDGIDTILRMPDPDHAPVSPEPGIVISRGRLI
jgi:hypothetical protein